MAPGPVDGAGANSVRDWYMRAKASTVFSEYALPMNCIVIGSPDSEKPLGTDRGGSPAAFPTAPMTSTPLAWFSCSMGGATASSGGDTRASYRDSISSIAR